MRRRSAPSSLVVNGLVPAAEYVRMSTEMQHYSGVNQQAAIRAFAGENGYSIVRTYADEGRSGLHLKGRAGLQALLRDVESGQTPFAAVIVYDISRWGRFQDADESAFYEFLCRRAGLKVIYCAEPFVDDGSTVNAIFKSIKRAMAGEYSRDLSEKIFKGQSRMVERGFRQGGPPGYGLRRMRVDAFGAPQGLMKKGEHKSLKTDRTVLVPGPPHEVSIVRRIFQLCAEGNKPRRIAEILNTEGVEFIDGRRWSYASVKWMLTSEKYIGANVFNRVSNKLGKPREPNPMHLWVRRETSFESVVSIELFERAQETMACLARSPSDEVLLARLRALLERRGFLSSRVIDEARGFTAAGYCHRFGSLYNAYALIGYEPDHVLDEMRVREAVKRTRARVESDVQCLLKESGIDALQLAKSGDFTLSGDIGLSIQLHRCVASAKDEPRWNIWLGTKATSDLVLLVRLDPANEEALDYHLFPRMLLPPGRFRMVGSNSRMLKQFRFDDLAQVTGRLRGMSQLFV